MSAKRRVKSIRKIVLGVLGFILVFIVLSSIYLKSNVVTEPRQDERVSNLLKHTETLTLLEELYEETEELEIVNKDEGVKVEKGKIMEDEKTRLEEFSVILDVRKLLFLKRII